MNAVSGLEIKSKCRSSDTPPVTKLTIEDRGIVTSMTISRQFKMLQILLIDIHVLRIGHEDLPSDL